MKSLFKSLALILIAASLIFSSSCGVNRGTPVMTLGGKSVTDHMYEYWMCSYKAVLMSQYSDARESDDFWDMEISDGTTAEDFFFDLTYNYIESNLVAMYLFDELGLEIDGEDREKAEEIISDLKEAYAGGNRNDFNRLLANYGVNADLLLEIYLEELKSTYVYNHVFENGILTDDPVLVNPLAEQFDSVWRGAHCAACGQRLLQRTRTCPKCGSAIDDETFERIPRVRDYAFAVLAVVAVWAVVLFGVFQIFNKAG